MPRGLKGEWRLAYPVARAVHIGRLATDRIEKTSEAPRDPEADYAVASRRTGIGGKARAASLTPERRWEIAEAGAAARAAGGA